MENAKERLFDGSSMPCMFSLMQGLPAENKLENGVFSAPLAVKLTLPQSLATAKAGWLKGS